MILNDIVKDSIFCSCGTIQDPKDISQLYHRLLSNYNVISAFDTIIVSQNKSEKISDSDFEKFNNVWRDVFRNTNITIIPLQENKGYVLGCLDLESTVLNECKKHKNKKYVWKSVNDFYIEKKIFDYEYNNEDFLFIPEIGYAGIVSIMGEINDYINEFNSIESKHFFPQLNFYILDIKYDFLIETDRLNEMYTRFINDSRLSVDDKQKQWEITLPTPFLINMLKRNCYTNEKSLVSKQKIIKLIENILKYRIADSSLKNVFFEEIGVCHFHFIDKPCLVI